MPKKQLLGISFYAKSAQIRVQKTDKGSRKKAKLPTKGRNGTDRISLWREICGLLENEEIPGVVRDLLLRFASVTLTLTFSPQKASDVALVRAGLDAEQLPLLSAVQRIWPGQCL